MNHIQTVKMILIRASGISREFVNVHDGLRCVHAHSNCLKQSGNCGLMVHQLNKFINRKNFKRKQILFIGNELKDLSCIRIDKKIISFKNLIMNIL